MCYYKKNYFTVPTMRGDFEVLLFNIIQWICGSLPWEKNLKDPSAVQQQKEKAFNNVQKFLKECFTSEVPGPVSQFMTLLASLKYNEVPNYNKFREILVKGLQKLNHIPTGKLEFATAKKQEKPPSTPKKTKTATANDKGAVKKIKSTPAKASTPAKSTETTKTPRGKRNAALASDALNASIDSIVLDEKCMSGKDMRRQLLENIDGDAEYEVQIKKRKIKPNTSNIESPSKPPVKRSRKKIIDVSLTDSEPEVLNFFLIKIKFRSIYE